MPELELMLLMLNRNYQAAQLFLETNHSLIDLNSQIDILDKFSGMTPLMVACLLKSHDLIIALLNYLPKDDGAIPMRDSKGYTALHYFLHGKLEKGWQIIADALIRNNKNYLMTPDFNGNLPLHLVVLEAQIEPKKIHWLNQYDNKLQYIKNKSNLTPKGILLKAITNEDYKQLNEDETLFATSNIPTLQFLCLDKINNVSEKKLPKTIISEELTEELNFIQSVPLKILNGWKKIKISS